MRTKTLLIIDDDPDDRELFCDALKEVDGSAICYSCKNGLEAIDMLTSEEAPIPDFIFLDLNMPILNGKQCLRELKKIRKLEQSHIVIYTTSKLTEDLSETLSMGAMHFMTKPIKFADLCRAISNMLVENWAFIR
jgi:CheY-like chemotaxis protein